MEKFTDPVMDSLFQIAQMGDVEKLQQLLAEKPLILHQVSLTCAENPLHISSAAGHLDFTREILKLKPEFARELNPEGFSPMHLASANGYVEIVQEMIRVDPKICRVQGREEKTPFHSAVLTGRGDVISEMLSNCEGCIEDVTVQKETALHLAVRKCQFESFRVMLDWIRQRKKEDILNMKDEHGNTVLHLATWKKQRQVLDLILGSGPGTLEVNAVNKSGLTALDLLLNFPSEAGDIEIQEILKGAGALRAQDLALEFTINSSAGCPPAGQNVRKLLEYSKSHDGRDAPSDVRSTLLVIASLVAIATYQVGVNPPGGLWRDDNGHVAGTSVMASHYKLIYVSLMALNTIGFLVSIYMIDSLAVKFPLRTALEICLCAVFFTYQLSVLGICPTSSNVYFYTCLLLTSVPVIGSLLRKLRVFRR